MQVSYPFIEINEELYYCPLAEFGSTSIRGGQLEGKIVFAEPITGEIPLLNEDIAGHICLLKRGVCDFVTKVMHAQIAGAIGAIIINSDEKEPENAFVMTAGRRIKEATSISIPSLMISLKTAEVLEKYKQNNTTKDIVSIFVLDFKEAAIVLENQENEFYRKKQKKNIEENQKKKKKQLEIAEVLRSRIDIYKPSESGSFFTSRDIDEDLGPLELIKANKDFNQQAVPSATPVVQVINPSTDIKSSASINLSDALENRRMALVVFDVQYYCALPQIGKHSDRNEMENQYYFNRVKKIVLPNLQLLQAHCRSKGTDVIYSTIESATQSGKDRSMAHKVAGIHVPKNSFESKILESISPSDDEIIIPRTGVSVFGTTNIDYILRNLDVQCIIITGISTIGSLDAAVRDGSDRGYAAIVIEDALAFDSEKEHLDAIAKFIKSGCTVIQTADMINP